MSWFLTPLFDERERDDIADGLVSAVVQHFRTNSDATEVDPRVYNAVMVLTEDLYVGFPEIYAQAIERLKSDGDTREFCRYEEEA